MFDELTRNELYSIVAKIEDYTRGVKISNIRRVWKDENGINLHFITSETRQIVYTITSRDEGAITITGTYYKTDESETPVAIEVYSILPTDMVTYCFTSIPTLTPDVQVSVEPDAYAECYSVWLRLQEVVK